MTGQSNHSQGAESALGIATIAIHHPTVQPGPQSPKAPGRTDPRCSRRWQSPPHRDLR